ncbi:ABC transporter substrate-binding protein [uncultured Draconibacterium sp.]|uniref:ABC transporter substrate-binding protein n=1 Tax=uncultured Draconibacterium sp. TaxID=1573823 RepID=UPI002AA600FA|nr:ABC transporter substrate-binding protein [uncultured Draconibacterium sp.]
MKIIKHLAFIIIVVSLFSCNRKEKAITVLSFGGTFAEAQKEAYYRPFEEETGITVQEANYNGEYGKIEAAIKTNDIPWNVIDVESAALMRGIENGLFEKLDYSIIDTTDIINAVINDYAVGTDIYSLSLGYSKAFDKLDSQPNSWKDFWDVEKYPGFRTLKKDPKFNFEIALMADGVPIEHIYDGDTLDIERAFRKLDEIKPYIKVWWTTGQQPIQLLADGEVVMAGAFGARLWTAEHLDNRPLALTWNQSIADVDYWAVPKGAKDKELAMKFINSSLQPEKQVNFSKIFPLGPTNKRAFEYIDDSVAKELNTYPENFQKHIILNTKYWQKNEEKIIDRWNEWLLK